MGHNEGCSRGCAPACCWWGTACHPAGLHVALLPRTTPPAAEPPLLLPEGGETMHQRGIRAAEKLPHSGTCLPQKPAPEPLWEAGDGMRRGLSQHFPSRHGPEPQPSGWHHSSNFSLGRLCLCPTGSQFKQPARHSQTVVCLGCVACEAYHTFPPAMQNVFGWKSAGRNGKRELGHVQDT